MNKCTREFFIITDVKTLFMKLNTKSIFIPTSLVRQFYLTTIFLKLNYLLNLHYHCK